MPPPDLQGINKHGYGDPVQLQVLLARLLLQKIAVGVPDGSCQLQGGEGGSRFQSVVVRIVKVKYVLYIPYVYKLLTTVY